MGDQFTLQLQAGELQHYKVTQIEVVHQSQSTFLQTLGLYLLTSYPFDSLVAGTESRWLVSAQLLSEDVASADISSPDSLRGISMTNS